MLSPRGARGVEKAELNGNVDSDNNHGGSSRTYVLHRAGCSQEDDQLLRQGCEWSSSPGRQAWGNAPRAGHLDENSAAALDSNSPRRIFPTDQVAFTDRETQVLKMLVEGRSNKEIGTPLGIGERTVKAHVAKLMRKVGVENRVALTVHAITHSLVSLH